MYHEIRPRSGETTFIKVEDNLVGINEFKVDSSMFPYVLPLTKEDKNYQTKLCCDKLIFYNNPCEKELLNSIPILSDGKIGVYSIYREAIAGMHIQPVQIQQDNEQCPKLSSSTFLVSFKPIDVVFYDGLEISVRRFSLEFIKHQRDLVLYKDIIKEHNNKLWDLLRNCKKHLHAELEALEKNKLT